MMLVPISLIPICALLNHLGGQSTVIPNPRLTCRVFGITAAFGVIAFLCGVPDEKLSCVTAIVLAGMALWTVPAWAQGFMALGTSPGSALPPDRRNYSGLHALASITDRLMGVNQLTKLTNRQCRLWGCIYMSMRGLYIYPLFCGLGWQLAPWAYVIGLGGALMGILYATSSEVLYAEWKMGAVIGAMLAGTILMA